MKRLILLVLASLTSAFAQGPAPGFFPGWDTPLVRDLGLSEDQQQKIRATVQEYRDRLARERTELRYAENQLQDTFNADQIDEATANKAIEKAIARRGDMTRTVSQMSLKLRMILTSQQWQELRKRRPMEGFPPRRDFGAGRRQRLPGPGGLPAPQNIPPEEP